MDKKYYDNRRDSGSNNRNLLPIVKRILSRKKSFLNLVNKRNTPFYVYDQEGMDEDIDRFIKSFKVHIPNFQSYYALKLNHHPLIVRHAVEKGIRLSGGERQRVGIARALAKNPHILIFDEASSNLDTENEALIHQAMREALRGRTGIIITHRLSTIKDVDKIVVFNRGQVVGIGTHNELVEICEPYRRLIEKQVVSF